MTACPKLFLFDRISHGKVFSLFLFFVQSIYRKSVTYQNSKRSGRRMMRKDKSVFNFLLIIFQKLFSIRVTVTLSNIINDSFRVGLHLNRYSKAGIFLALFFHHCLWQSWVSIGCAPRSRSFSYCGDSCFRHGLRTWEREVWDKNQESLDGNKEFRNPGRRGRRHSA